MILCYHNLKIASLPRNKGAGNNVTKKQAKRKLYAQEFVFLNTSIHHINKHININNYTFVIITPKSKTKKTPHYKCTQQGPSIEVTVEKRITNYAKCVSDDLIT